MNAAPIYVVSRGNGQGFILVAGDNRITPVWGIIEKGDYSEGINPNFDFMMGRLQEEVLSAISGKEVLRDSIYENLRIKLGIVKTPNTKGDDGLLPDPPGAPDLDVPENFDRMEVVERDMYYEMVYEYGPLLKTKWSQWWPYDSEVSKYYPGCPVGCEATSAAQIMAYHKHPTYMAATGHTYLWDKMLNGSWSQEAVVSVGQLMFDLGLEPYLHVKYGSEGSYAGYSHAARTFEAFGYTTNGAHRKYNYNDIYNEVYAGRPSHICGNDGGRLGHAWVADGALNQNSFVTYYAQFYLGDKMIREIKGATSMKSSVSYIHHNFGWDGLHDGWYGSLDPGMFNVPPKKPNEPNPSDCRKNMEIIIGIQPK